MTVTRFGIRGLRGTVALSVLSLAGAGWAQAPAENPNSSAVAGAVQASPAADTAAAPDAQGGVGEIVVTAQRRSQRLSEVPISIQAIDAATLSKTGVTSTIEFLKITPSVNFVSGFSPAATSVTIRGISSVAQEGGIQPSTAVIVDDVPLARQGEFVSDFGDVDHIEVLRGPQGTLFGKNATAGVINIVNKKPTSTYEGWIEGGYSTDNEKLVRGVVNIPLSDNVRARFNGFYRDLSQTMDNHADLVRSARFKDTGGEKTYGFSGKLAADISPDFDLLLSGDYYRQMSTMGANVVLVPNSDPFLGGLQVSNDVVASAKHPFVTSDNPTYSTIKGYGASLALNGRLGDGLSIHSTTAYRTYNWDSSTDADGGPWGAWRGVGILPIFFPVQYIVTGAGGTPRAPDRTHYWSEELKLNYSSGPLDLVAGGYLQRLDNKRHNTVPYILYLFGGPGYLDNEIDSKITDNIYSVFGDATYKLTPALSVFGGLRFSYEKLHVDYHRNSYFGQPTDTFDPIALVPTSPPDQVVEFSEGKTQKNLSGRIGVRFAPDSRHSYYASYSRGYKGPAIDVSRVAVADGAFIKPEIADAFELGTKHVFFDNHVTANLALFYQTVKDVQQSALIPGTTTSRLQNAGKIRSYGAEFDLSAQVTPELRFDGGLAYVHAEYRDFTNSCYPGQTVDQGCVGGLQDMTGKPAISQPRFSGSLAAIYNINLPTNVPFDMFLRGGVTYKSKTPYGLNGDPLLVQPRYALLDAQIGLNGRENRWQLLLYVKNITNKAYALKLQEADNFIGRVFANYGRDFKRYGGMTLRANF